MKRKREREMIKVRNDEQKKARVQQQQKYRDNKRERMGEAAYLAENARYERERYRRKKAMGKPRVKCMKHGAVRKRIRRERTALKKREAELAAMARINATDNNTAAVTTATVTAAATATINKIFCPIVPSTHSTIEIETNK